METGGRQRWSEDGHGKDDVDTEDDVLDVYIVVNVDDVDHVDEVDEVVGVARDAEIALNSRLFHRQEVPVGGQELVGDVNISWAARSN